MLRKCGPLSNGLLTTLSEWSSIMVHVSRWIGICFAGILVLSLSTILAEDDKEKKEDEAKEHATAKKVLAAAKIDLLAAVKAATQKFP